MVFLLLPSFAGDRVRESLQQVIASPLYTELKPSKDLVLDLRYASQNNFVGKDMYGVFKQAFLHREAAQKFSKARELLQKKNPGYRFVIFDALRPRSVQRILWDKVKGTDQQGYVGNPDRGSMHNFGMAIDLSIQDEKGKELDMGTPFDDFSDLAQPQLEEKHLKEKLLSPEQIKNRHLLREVMTQAGFIQLPHEWWHYDALPGDQVRANYPIVE